MEIEWRPMAELDLAEIVTYILPKTMCRRLTMSVMKLRVKWNYWLCIRTLEEWAESKVLENL